MSGVVVFGGFVWLVIVVGLLVYFERECVDPVKKQLTIPLRTNEISIKRKCCFFKNSLIMYKATIPYLSEWGKITEIVSLYHIAET